MLGIRSPRRRCRLYVRQESEHPFRSKSWAVRAACHCGASRSISRNPERRWDVSGDGGVARCPPPACNQGADGIVRATAGRDRKARANAYGACRKLTLLPPNLRLIRKPGQAELRLGGHCRKCRTSLAAPSSTDACALSVWCRMRKPASRAAPRSDSTISSTVGLDPVKSSNLPR